MNAVRARSSASRHQPRSEASELDDGGAAVTAAAGEAAADDRERLAMETLIVAGLSRFRTPFRMQTREGTMRRLLIASLAAAAAMRPATALAQMQISRMDDPPRTAAYFEVGGNAMFSGNVDVLVAPHTSVRVGGFASPLTLNLGSPWNALLMANQLFGSDGHYVEVGVGIVALHRFDELEATAAGVTSSVGYRIQSKRQFGRVVLTPSPPRADHRRRRAVLGFSYGFTF